MSPANRFATNLRNLRRAYGETQEQLGTVIYTEKNTISSYENGHRMPSEKTLSDIAKHYMISVEELLYSDLTDLESVDLNYEILWKRIDELFPVVTSGRALQNKDFNSALNAHKALYKNLRMLRTDNLDNIPICLAGYRKAFSEEDIKVEVAADFVALWLMAKLITAVPVIINDRPALLYQAARKDEAVKKIIENNDSSVEEDLAGMRGYLDEEMTEMIPEMLILIKKSKEWSDLADYYLALQYICNVVENGLDWEFNRRIGIEMLMALASVENEYAIRYLMCCLSVLGFESSQSVNDN